MAIDMGSIAALVSSVQAAAEIAKSMIGLRDATVLQNKVIELNGVILSAQESAFTAQTNQFALSQRIRDLEAKVAEMEAWDTEKQRYHLSEVGLGSLAYVLKPEAQCTEPPHSICANCYQQHKKYILQKDYEIGCELLRCHACQTRLRVKDVPISTGGRISRS